MKPSIAPTKAFTVEGLTNTHCGLLLALLSNFRLDTDTPYGTAALELIEILEYLDLGTEKDVQLVAVMEEDEVVTSEIFEFILEIR